MEREPKLEENFIGDMAFGITIEAIQAHADEIKKELSEVNAELTKKDLQESFKKFYINRKAKIEGFLSVTPDDIFRSLQEVYDFVHQMEAEKMKEDNILRSINEKPELVEAVLKFYGILRTQPWGYRLGQRLTAFRANE